MATADLLVYGLILIPFLVSLIAGYAKLRIGPFFGLAVAAGAISTLLSYLLFDLLAALLQLAALAGGALLFFLAIGLLGEKFSYRSSMLLLASVGLFPLGLTLSTGFIAPLIALAILLVANILFALLLVQLRRNTLSKKKDTERPKQRFLLTIPAVVSTVVVGLMILAKLSEGSLL